jgi:hypothetical protein
MSTFFVVQEFVVFLSVLSVDWNIEWTKSTLNMFISCELWKMNKETRANSRETYIKNCLLTLKSINFFIHTIWWRIEGTPIRKDFKCDNSKIFSILLIFECFLLFESVCESRIGIFLSTMEMKVNYHIFSTTASFCTKSGENDSEYCPINWSLPNLIINTIFITNKWHGLDLNQTRKMN